jgi:hypothetical protein
MSNLPGLDKGIKLHLADVLLISYLHENTINFSFVTNTKKHYLKEHLYTYMYKVKLNHTTKLTVVGQQEENSS